MRGQQRGKSADSRRLPRKKKSAASLCIRLTEHVWFRVTDMFFPAFQRLANRKNKLPVGGVMVMLFVPLAVVTV